jgi:hypothetical protein
MGGKLCGRHFQHDGRRARVRHADAGGIYLPKSESDEFGILFHAGGALDDHSHVRGDSIHDLLIPYGGGSVNEKQDEENNGKVVTGILLALFMVC